MPGQSFALLIPSSVAGCREHCEYTTERCTRPKFSLPRSVWSWENQVRQEARLRPSQRNLKRNLKRDSTWDLRHSRKLTGDLRHLKMKSLISKPAGAARDDEPLPSSRHLQLLSWTMKTPKCGWVCPAPLPRTNTN